MSDWYQIENSYFTLQVNSSGAEMRRLFAKAWHRELLWAPQNESAQKVWKRSAPVLFPIVGKLKDDTYILKDKSYQMPQHGFARDKNFKCLACSSIDIEFLLEADQETFEQYPFCFELRVKYELVGKNLIITYNVKNVDRQEIYFSIGAHPAFETTITENYEIQFEKQEKEYFQIKNGLVDWSLARKLETNKLSVTPQLFDNDALIFRNLKSSYIDLVDNKRHETLRVHGTNTPFLGIWGKDTIPFVCIEPWYGVSDDAKHGQDLELKNGIQVLKEGKDFTFSYSIELRESK